MRYDAAIERAFYRALNNLQKLQAARRRQASSTNENKIGFVPQPPTNEALHSIGFVPPSPMSRAREQAEAAQTPHSIQPDRASADHRKWTASQSQR
jgi:hypothetical protein